MDFLTSGGSWNRSEGKKSQYTSVQHLKPATPLPTVQPSLVRRMVVWERDKTKLEVNKSPRVGQNFNRHTLIHSTGLQVAEWKRLQVKIPANATSKRQQPLVTVLASAQTFPWKKCETDSKNY